MPTFHAAQATWQTGVAATVTPNWPTGYSTALANDLAVCIVHSGGSAAPTPATPANWTQLATFNGGGGTHGNASGPRRTTIFTRELTAGAVPSAPAFSSLGASTIMGATIHVIRMDDPSGTWTVEAFTAEDTTTGTTVNLTFTTANGKIAAGDLLMGVFSSAENGTVSGQTLVATGATIGAVTERHDQVNTANPDVKGSSYTASVTAGSNTANATSAITASATSTGGAILVRFRESGGTSPTLVATSRDSQTDANAATNTCPVPAGAAVDDHAILAIEVFLDSSSAPVTPTWPTGFTQIVDHQQTPSGGSQLLIAKKKLTAADSGNYVTTLGASRWNQSICALIRDADQVVTPDANSVKGGGPGTSISSLSLTTSGLAALLHFQSNSSSGSHTPPTNFVERQDSDYLTLATQIPGVTGSQTSSGATQATSTVWAAALIAVEQSSGQTVTVGQPSTTDTVPGAVTRQKTRTPTQPSTTDTALAATRSKIKTVGQPSTTDSAPAVTKSRTRTVGQPATTDTALPVQVRPIKVAVGQPSTTDTAQPVTRRKVVAVGQPSTTDTAPPVAKAKQKTITLAATTDTAIAPTRRKIRTTGLPSTTDLALTVGRLKLRLVGQPATTDTARPVGQGGTTRITVGQPSDTSTALPVVKLKRKAAGLPASTDSARPAARIKLRTPTQPATVDEVLAPARLKRKTVGQPLEVDSAFAAARLKARIVGQPSTLDAAHRVYYPRIVRVGQPFTVDTARPVFNVAAVVPVVTGHLGRPRLTGSLPVRLGGYFTEPNIEGGI